MEWRETAVKAEKAQAQFDPTKQWTIETPVRALNEKKEAKDNNQVMKNMLDQQVAHIVQVRQQSREADISTARKHIEADQAQ